MKVVYFGSDLFLPCFEYFVNQHEILALYTYHNDEDYFSEYSIRKLAEQNGIPVHYNSVTTEEVTRFFTEEGCALFFSAEYNRIIPIPANLPQFRGINIHNSLLPQGRSYYPIEAGMERELSRTGVTMHKLEPQLDRGAILAQRSFPITPEMDSIDIYLHCAENARQMLEEIMRDFDSCWSAAQKQTEKLPYWKRPEDNLLTLRHEMCRSEANAVFRKYNSMTQVFLGGRWYYVTALTAGEASLTQDLFISPTLALFSVQDGHLRLHLRSMEGQQ